MVDIELEFYELLRDGVSIMQRGFRDGNISGGAGAGVQTSFKVRIGRITYGYDIFKDKEKEFGIGDGLKFYRFRAEDAGFSDRDSRFDYDFFGPVLYGSASF